MAKPRVYPPIYLFASILIMIGLHKLWPLEIWIVAPWRYAGIALMAAGLAVVLRVAAIFRSRETTIRPLEESAALVTEGPFRWSRNPIYVGMMAALAGVGILLGSLAPFLVLPVFFGIISLRFVRGEERMLEQTFGDSYREYRRRVRRWL